MLDYVRLILKIVIYWLLSLYFVYNINSTHISICDSRFKWFSFQLSSIFPTEIKRTKHVDLFCCASHFADWGWPKKGRSLVCKSYFCKLERQHPKGTQIQIVDDTIRFHQVAKVWILNPGNTIHKDNLPGGKRQLQITSWQILFWIWCDLSWKSTQTHAPHQQLPCATKKPVRRYISPCWHSMRVLWPKCTHWLCAPPKNERNNSKVYRNLSKLYPSVRGKMGSLH